MYVNTEVVTALMTLKGVSAADLTKVTGIQSSKVKLWLAGYVEDDVLPRSLQIALLGALGVHDGALRGDMVHNWDIYEPLLFGHVEAAWNPLETVIAAFGGKAEAAYVTAEEDPFFSLNPVTVYLLRFPSFLATLRVHASLLRPCRFEPSKVEGLSWSADNVGVLLDACEYEKVAAGEIGAKPLHRLLSQTAEPSRWDALIRAAQEAKVQPEHLLRIMLAYKAHQLSSPRSQEAADASVG